MCLILVSNYSFSEGVDKTTAASTDISQEALVDRIFESEFGHHQSEAESLSPNCWDTAVSQFEMNRCSYYSLERSNKELGLNYDKLISMAKNTSTALELSKKAEDARRKYNAEYVELYYPTTEHDLMTYGSFHPVCVYDLYNDLTVSNNEAVKICLGSLEKSKQSIHQQGNVNTAEAKLNALYKKSLIAFSNKPEKVNKIHRVQQAWVAYFNAYMRLCALTGTDDKIKGACANQLKQHLFEHRIKDLQAWLVDPYPDDMCSRREPL